MRLQARYRGRLGVEVGIFVAVDHLRRAGRLSADDEETYFAVEDWFLEALADPPFYADGNSIGAVTWFRQATAGGMLARLEPLRDILTRYGVEHELVLSQDPGVIVYEDDYQVGVVPYERGEPTPLPPGVVLGPTTAGSKRQFASDKR